SALSPGTALVVRASAQPAGVTVRRFAIADWQPIGAVAARDVAVVRFPLDHSPVPWHAEVSGAGATIETCP
ncbi:MAG: hypothetical protein ABI276_02225, partial [Acidimicrobiales bacterium]